MNNPIKTIFYLLIFSLLGSCSSIKSIFEKKQPFRESFETLASFENKDFKDHYSSLGKIYINSPGIKTIQIDKKVRAYFNSLYSKITSNNELFLKKVIKPKFFIIKDPIPFYFSLPNAQFYFSLGLIKKYFKNEALFVAALTGEIIKSVRSIFTKNIIVPVGYINTDRILSLVRIPVEAISELNKWTFFTMKRSGFDPFASLIWIQTKNRNALDFNLLLGGSGNITREEFLFKNFIVQNRLQDKYSGGSESNSSPEFYYLMNFLRRIK